jgi:hypothetical protein
MPSRSLKPNVHILKSRPGPFIPVLPQSLPCSLFFLLRPVSLFLYHIALHSATLNHILQTMSPVAVTLPPVKVKPLTSATQLGIKRVDTANLGTKRKNICFSGTYRTDLDKMRFCSRGGDRKEHPEWRDSGKSTPAALELRIGPYRRKKWNCEPPLPSATPRR